MDQSKPARTPQEGESAALLQVTGHAAWSESAKRRVGELVAGVTPKMMAAVVALMEDISNLVQVLVKATRTIELSP
eukprot:9144603-Pyramimonas_sp.AAC.1